MSVFCVCLISLLLVIFLIIENPLELIIYFSIPRTVMCFLIPMDFTETRRFKAHRNVICCLHPKMHEFLQDKVSVETLDPQFPRYILHADALKSSP